MTGVCFTWLHSASSLWFPCRFWQEFLQSCLREVLENAVGQQPPACCWLSPQIPWKGHLEKLLWCPCLSRADLWDPDLSHACGVSSGLGLLCFPWLLLGFSGPEHSSSWITLSLLSVLGSSLQPWFCWNHFWQSLIPSSLFGFNVMLPESLTSLDISNVLIFTHPAASTFSLRNMGKLRIFLGIFFYIDGTDDRRPFAQIIQSRQLSL